MEKDSAINQAWDQYRQGQTREAAGSFSRIIQGNAAYLDAHYGLGLAERQNGNMSASENAFRRALELAREAKVVEENRTDGKAEPERYLMLIRMIRQRLMEIGAQA